VQTPVKADTASGADWIVTSGLRAGDRVIVSGAQQARNGALVKPVETPATSATSAAAAASATPVTADHADAASAAHT
jgi:membrane fusion protein, multidrug efflux system